MESHKKEILHYQNDAGTGLFQEWVDDLKDVRGRAAILKRIDRVAEGLFGDHRYVDKGVWELRIDFGPGYRIYYGEDDPTTVILLLAGDKGSQVKDIHQAHKLWANYRRTL